MRLETLTARGLKSLRDLVLKVPALLAITSPNGTGKTAVFNAIRLLTIGYEPSAGRKLVATRELASGKEIEVAGAFDSGLAIERTFGKSMETHVAPSNGESTEAEAQQRIDTETGSFVLSLDLASFTSLTPEKRKQALFAMLPRDSAGLTEDVFRHWLGYEAGDTVVRKAIDFLWGEHVAQNASALDGLQIAIETAREKANEAESDRRKQEQVAQAAERDAAVAADAAAYDPEVAERLQSELAVLEQQVGELTERQQAAIRADRAVREHAHNVEVLTAREREAQTSARAAAEKLESLQGTTPDLPALEQAADLARRRAAGQREAVKYTAECLSAVRAERDTAQKRILELDDQCALLQKMQQCPTCGSDIDPEKALRLSEEMVRLGTLVVDEITPRVTTAGQAAADAEQRQRELDAAERDARIALDQARKHEAEIQATAAILARMQDNAKAAENELLRLKAAPPAAAEPYDADRLLKLQEEARELRARIRQQGELRDLATAARRDRERAETEQKKYTQLEQKAEKLKTLHSALQRLRAHVLQEMVGPVERHANEILQQIDPAKTFAFTFEREGRDHLDLGFEEAGQFRTLKAASKGESIFIALVFVAAMLAVVQPPWRVLMIDDVEGLDAERLRWLMVALAKVQHHFDNVILGSCREFPAIEGWHVVDLRDELGHRAEAAA